MYISFERSSVQKMPVLIMSQRLAARPGIMVANSVRIYSGGGRVGLIDMMSVPALMMLGGAILGWARNAPGAMASTDAAAPAFSRLRRRAPVMDLRIGPPRSVPPTECNFDAEGRRRQL